MSIKLSEKESEIIARWIIEESTEPIDEIQHLLRNEDKSDWIDVLNIIYRFSNLKDFNYKKRSYKMNQKINTDVNNINNNKEGFYKDKTMKIATIKVNLRYYFDYKMSDRDIRVALENVELPSRYVEDSYELVKIIKEEV